MLSIILNPCNDNSKDDKSNDNNNDNDNGEYTNDYKPFLCYLFKATNPLTSTQQKSYFLNIIGRGHHCFKSKFIMILNGMAFWLLGRY